MIILDADGLIKLHRAGVLERVVRSYACVISDAVYNEVVTLGIERGYQDAEEIGQTVAQGIAVSPAPSPEVLTKLGLGHGETATLALAYQLGEESIIVTDDRQFRSLLTRCGIPFLVPAAFIVVMAQQGFISKTEAGQALDRLKPIIRATDYQLAVGDLEKLSEEES